MIRQIGLWTGVLLLSVGALASSPWRKYAEHLTGGATSQTEDARKKLLAIPTLDQVQRKNSLSLQDFPLKFEHHR